MSSPSPARAPTVWIVNPYGWLPGEAWRDYRSAPLSAALAARGCQVRWWISDIEHRSRKRRTVDVEAVALPLGVTLEMVASNEYDGNISLDRIRYERRFAAGFAARSKLLPPPDVIVLAEPALFFSGPVVAYARRRAIPVIVDGIDLWPEMFHLVLPRMLRAFGGVIFAPLYRRRDRLVAKAAAVVAVTGDYLARLTRRVAPPLRQAIYLGVDRRAFHPPRFDHDEMLPIEAVYAGNLGDAYDMPVLMAAIERLAAAERPINFTIAGAGPWERHAASMAERFPEQVRFLGRVPPAALPDLYVQAQIGLATYSEGSAVSMPTKLFDYLAGGLATVGSMGGEAVELLRDGRVGRSYQAGSVDDLVAALDFYIDDRERLMADRRAAFELSAHFDLANQYERYAELVETVAARAARTGDGTGE